MNSPEAKTSGEFILYDGHANTLGFAIEDVEALHAHGEKKTISLQNKTGVFVNLAGEAQAAAVVPDARAVVDTNSNTAVLGVVEPATPTKHAI